MPSKPSAPYYRVRYSKIHGKGAFATRAIRKGTRVAEYTGELIPQDEADRREPYRQKGHHHTFLFQICDGDVCIDASAGGGPAKWINHSCDPNCEAVEFEGRVFIYALRAIRPGEELSYDYKLIGDDLIRGKWQKKYACSCGARICTGNMLLKPRKHKKRKSGTNKLRK